MYFYSKITIVPSALPSDIVSAFAELDCSGVSDAEFRFSFDIVVALLTQGKTVSIGIDGLDGTEISIDY